MAATEFISDPVIVSSNRFHDIGNYVKKLFANDSLRWGSIWPWEFPQKGTKDEEEKFLRECFGDREIHMQGGAGKHGNGFRFLKQAWYSAALYNFETRVPLTVQWWFDTNQELWRDPNSALAESFFKPDVKVSTFFLDPHIKLFGAKFLEVVVNEIQKKLSTVLAEKQEPATLSVDRAVPLESSSPSGCVQPGEQVQSGENADIQEKTATSDQVEVKHQALESEQPIPPQGIGLTTDVAEVSGQPVSPKSNTFLNPAAENCPPTAAAVHQLPPRPTSIDADAQSFHIPRQPPGYAPSPRPSMPFQGYGNENYHNKKNGHTRRESDHGRRNTSWSGYRHDSSTYRPINSVRPAMDMTTSWSPAQPFYPDQPPHSHFAHQSSTNNRQNPSFARERRGSKHIMDPGSFSRDLPAPPASSNTPTRLNRGNDHRQFSHHNPNMMPWPKNENVYPRHWTGTNHGAGGYKHTPHVSHQHYVEYNQHHSPAQYTGHQSQAPFEGFHPLSHEKPFASRSLNTEPTSGPNLPFGQQQAYFSEVLPPPGLVPYMPMPLPPPHYSSHDKIGERNRPATDVTLREEPKYVPPHKKPNVNLQKSRGPCGNGCDIYHIDEACGSATQLVAQNVPSTVTGELLHHMFSKYGTVHHIYRSYRAAFVDYEMPESASLCLAKQADLRLYVNNMFVEVSRMHCDPRFLFSSHEARTNFLRSDHQHYDHLAKWLADNRASLRNFDQPNNALPQSVPRGEPAQNRPEAVDDSTQPKKSKKGTHKKKPEGRPEVVAKRLHDPPSSSELCRKHESEVQMEGKSSKKKNQQHPRRRAEQTEPTEPKTLPDHTAFDRAMSEPPQPTRKSRVRERSLPEVLMEESEPVVLPAEDAGQPIESQAAPTVEKMDVEFSAPAASPPQNAHRKPSAATSDIDESINISEPKTPDAGQAIELPTSEDLLPDLHPDKPNTTTAAVQKSDPAHIATYNYAEVARVKVEDEPEVPTKVSTPEPDSKVSDDLEIATKTETPVQEMVPTSPSVDTTTEATKAGALDASSPVAKKVASAAESARVVSSKKENQPKGPPATESLSQFGRKNEKKSKVPKGKGSIKGKPKLATLDDAITSATSSKPAGMDAQAEKSSDMNGSKAHPASNASQADVETDQSQQVAKKTEAQRNGVSSNASVKSTGSWLPNLTGFLSKTRQSPKVSPAAVVIAEQKIASPKQEPAKLEEPQAPPQAESASDDQMPPSPEIKIIITRSSSPEEPFETQDTQNVPEADDQPAPPSHIDFTDTVTQKHDASLPQADLAESADNASEPKAQKPNSDVAVKSPDHMTEGHETELQEPSSVDVEPTGERDEAQTKTKKKKKKSKKPKNKTQTQPEPEAKIVFISHEPAPHHDIAPLVNLKMPDDYEKIEDVASEDSVQNLPVTPWMSSVAKKIEQAVRKTSGVVEAPPARRKQKRHTYTTTKDDESDEKSLAVRQGRTLTPTSDDDSDVRVSPKFLLIVASQHKPEDEKEKEKQTPSTSSRLSLESSADLATSSDRIKQPEDDGYNQWADKDRNSILEGKSTRPAVEDPWESFPQVSKEDRVKLDALLHGMAVETAKEVLATSRARHEAQRLVEEVISDEEDEELGEVREATGSPLTDSVIGKADVVVDVEEETAKTSGE